MLATKGKKGYDSGSIRKLFATSNLLLIPLYTALFLSLFSGITYVVIGWPRSGVISSLLLLGALTTACTFLYNTHTDSAPIAQYPFIELVVGGILGLIPYYAFTHRAAGWMTSVQQLISNHALIAMSVLWCGALIYSLWRRCSPWFVAWCIFIATSLNSIMFPQGFGFDIFVHEATIRAWLTEGGVLPHTPLYSGFYGMIATLNSISHIQLLTLLRFTTPTLIAGALAVAYAHISSRTEQRLFLLVLAATVPMLWTTTTPQALGHALLFMLGIMMFYRTKPRTTTTIVLDIMIAGAIALIHPLSGIPALFLVAWEYVPCTWRAARGVVLIGSAALPALLIYVTNQGQFTTPSIIALFTNQRAELFQSHIVALLAYAWRDAIIIICGIFAVIGLSNERTRERGYFVISLIASAVLLSMVRIGAVIDYEQIEFARRSIIAAELLAFPLILAGLIRTQEKVSHHAQYVLGGAAVVIACFGIYTAYTPYNSAEVSKSRVVSPADFELVRQIDTHAQGNTYLVLADQITSAAALHVFGFTERTLPNSPDYFYPIPTGGEFYTNYFLPGTYGTLTRDMIKRARVRAGTQRVYFVVKPYWEPSREKIGAISSVADAYWTTADGTYIAEFK